MKYGVIVALLCLSAIPVTSQPNQTSTKREQSAEPKSTPATPAPNNNITTYYAERPDDNSPKWYAALERPDWWIVVIAAITGFAVFYQAREMKEATDVMRGQLKAMQDQIGQMEASGVQTTALIASAQRSADAAKISADIVAKVSVPTLKISEFKISTLNANILTNVVFFRRPEFQITIKNWGQTPAFLWAWTLKMTCDKLPATPIYEGVASGMPLEKQVIPGGGTVTLPLVGFPWQHDFSADDALAISEQNKPFAVYGYICYGDIFGNPLRRMKFCEVLLNVFGDLRFQWTELFSDPPYIGTDVYPLREQDEAEKPEKTN